MLPIVSVLLEKGLSILGNAVLAKGKDVIEDKLGIDLEAPMTPEQLLTLKQAEFQHEQWLLDAGIRKSQQELEETKLYLADVQNARGMQQTALQQDDLFSKRFLYYFATVIFGFTALYISAITFADVPTANSRTVDTVLGFLLATCLATIVQFFFGTSKSSSNKDSTIQSLAQAAQGRNV